MHHGIGLAVLSAALFGASTPLAKALLADIAPGLLAGLLYLGAGMGLAVVMILRRASGQRGHETPLARADVPWMAAVVVAGGIAGPLLMMQGLARTVAAGASLLLNLEGVATLAIAWVVFRENVDSRLFAGAMASLAGAIVLSWDGVARFDTGAILIAGACLAWGIDDNLTRRISGSDPVEIACIKGIFAGGVNTAIAMTAGAQLPDAGSVAAAAALGFVGYGISLVLFVHALRALGTARTGAYDALAPFVGAVLALPLLGETATPALGLAGVLMAAGLWLHLGERHAHPHDHGTLAHDHAHVHDLHHAHDHPPGTVTSEPHSHWHDHGGMVHSHAHYPDLHHRHTH